MFSRFQCFFRGHVWSDGRNVGHCEWEHSCLRCGGTMASFQAFYWWK